MARSIDIPWEMDENEYRYPWVAEVVRPVYSFSDAQVKRRFRVVREWPDTRFIKSLEIEWEDGMTDFYTEETVLSWIEKCKNAKL